MIRRIWNLLFGSMSKTVSKLEEANPEALIAKLNDDIDRQLLKASDAMVDIKVALKIAEREARKAQERLDSLQKAISQAISAKDEPLLAQLYLQEKELLKSLDMTRKLHEDTKQKHDKAMTEYNALKSELVARKTKLASLKTQADINKLRQSLLSVTDISGVTTNFGTDMDRAEAVVEKQGYRVEAKGEIADDNVMAKIRNMELSAEVEEAKAKAKAALATLEG